MTTKRWSLTLIVVGLVALLIGAIDPLEGSIVVLIGIALAAIGARIGHLLRRRMLYSSFALVLAGVTAMVALSIIGGIGGDTGRSNWWGLLVTPYPVGWLLGLIAIVTTLRDASRQPAG